MVCQCQGSEELAPELSAKGKRACPASILSARLLFAAVSVQGVAGLHSFGDVEARWWLHLYVMLVWVTCMRNMLLLSPPLRELLEKGLPPSVREALRMFAEKITDSTRMAASWASWGASLVSQCLVSGLLCPGGWLDCFAGCKGQLEEDVCFVFTYYRGPAHAKRWERPSTLMLLKRGGQARVVFRYHADARETPPHGKWRLQGNELWVQFNASYPYQDWLCELVLRKDAEGGRWSSTQGVSSSKWFVTLELEQQCASRRPWRWGALAAIASVALVVAAARCRQRPCVAAGTAGAVVAATALATAERL